MRPILLIAVLLIVLPAETFAQEAPPVEVFGSYSYLRPDGGGNLHGWNASVAVSLNRWLSVAGDFSGHYGSQSLRADTFDDDFPFDDFPGNITIRADSDANVHTILAGPRFSYRKHERLTTFAHALFGLSRFAADATISFGNATIETSFADIDFSMALGGGLDVRLSESVGLRLIQADYLVTNFGGNSQNNVRLSVGFTLR
jgi:hypothetical protein